jgi:Undecaprenyl-phosphate galactose phosphotransferase WbaP
VDATPNAVVAQSTVKAADACSRPSLAMMLVMSADLLGLSAAILFSAAVRHAFAGDYELKLYFQLWPTLLIFVLVYGLAGLYPALVFNAVSEIRQIAIATTLVYLILGVLTFMLRVSSVYSRLVFVFAWLLSLALVPLLRTLVRHLFGHRSWWGYPVVVLAGGGAEADIVKTLNQQPELGFRVRAVLQDVQDPDEIGATWETAPILSAHCNISHAILATPGLPARNLLDLLDTHARAFSHLYIVPDLEGLSSFGIEARDLARVLALEVRNRLLLPTSRVMKRIIDLALLLMMAPILIPLLVIITVLIKLDSNGPAFYSQIRIGLNEDRFKIWKFRSMVSNADRVLKEFLELHPALKEEWEHDQKLKSDPRVTRVGRFLRKTSLDELPQLWNVLKGEMSLVGPRPIVAAEIPKYAACLGLYARVPPGLTGLWQVSGRSDTTYAERVALDTYYVRNWSPWLDVYLIARTVKVVCECRGAY